jgi:hypothetical protein
MSHKELVFKAGVRVREGTALWLEDGPDVLVRSDNVKLAKRLLFARAMTCFEVERDFLKLASSIVASVLFSL